MLTITKCKEQGKEAGGASLHVLFVAVTVCLQFGVLFDYSWRSLSWMN